MSSRLYGYEVAVTTRVDVINALPATFEHGDWEYNVSYNEKCTSVVVTRGYIG